MDYTFLILIADSTFNIAASQDVSGPITSFMK